MDCKNIMLCNFEHHENRINMAALILVIYSETRMVVSIIKIISGSIRSGVVSHISKQMVKLIFFIDDVMLKKLFRKYRFWIKSSRK